MVAHVLTLIPLFRQLKKPPRMIWGAFFEYFSTMQRLAILISSACLLLPACADLSRSQISGPYYVAQDPAAPYMTLYYSGAASLDFERIRNVAKVGYTANFIFVESEGRFYYINRLLDQPTDLGNPKLNKALSQPLTPAAFRSVLDSLEIKSFTFQYSAS